MAKQLSADDKFFLTKAFDQLLKFAGLPNSLPYPFGDEFQDTTIANQTLWVDGTAGNDNNDGSESAPFKTIMAAVESLPRTRRHVTQISVKRGTYAETIKDVGIYGQNGGFTAGVTIEGIDLDTPTLASGGLTTVTLTTGTGYTWNATGAGWNTNELRGMALKPRTGSFATRLLPIAANTSNTVDLGTGSSALNNVICDLVTQAVTVTRDPNGHSASVMVNNSGAHQGSSGLTIKNMKLASGSSFGVWVGSGCVQVQGCNISAASSSCITAAGPAANLTLNYIYMAPTDSGLRVTYLQNLTIGNIVIHGGNRGIWGAGSVNQITFSAAGHVICQNQAIVGALFQHGPLYMDTYSAQKLVCRNGVVGLILQGAANILFQFCELTGNSSHGLQIQGTQFFNGNCHINAATCTITGNGGDGIRVESAMNAVSLAGCTVTGNTGFGVRLGGTNNTASHNSLWIDAASTFGTNTAGDLTLDAGSTAKTIADLRAASGKVLVDANYFHRIAGT
jgi:hypothetical protein